MLNTPPATDSVATSKEMNWDEYVANSNGQALFLPDSFKEEAEELNKMREDLNEDIKKVAKKEISLNVKTQAMFFKVREFLAETGINDVWVKDINFNIRALSEGKYIINILEQRQR